jgi:DNA-binding CsgD family transcriptional regulator
MTPIRWPLGPAICDEAIGGVIEAAGTRQSLDMLFGALAVAVPFEMVSVLVYRGQGRPLRLYDTFDAPSYRQGLDNYLRVSYVLNPCYQAYLGGMRSGVLRIKDLVSTQGRRAPIPDNVPAAESADEEIGYVTHGWPPGREEVLLLAPLGDDAVAEVGLLRPRAHGGFEDAHLAALRQAQPVVSATVRRFWREQAASAAPLPDSRIDVAFHQFGKPVLSAREREVARMILQGHSSESIGLHLGISVTTVKTHRKHAYAKLNISTQSELLSLFLKSLDVNSLDPNSLDPKSLDAG